MALDFRGVEILVGDTVWWGDEFHVVEAIEEGGIVRGDTHRILLIGQDKYVRPQDMVKWRTLKAIYLEDDE